MFPTLVYALNASRASWVPRVMCLGAVRTFLCNLLLRLVFLRAVCCRMAAAANATRWSTHAVCLMVVKQLAAETSQRLGRVGSHIKASPVSQVEVEMRREGFPDSNSDLPHLLETGGYAANCLFHLWVAL